jgi:D-cysteine desulfhydrase
VRVDPTRLELEQRFLGAGYGHPTAEASAAAELARRTEGLALEPVYTAKAVAALLDGLRSGRPTAGPVLYWHTHSGVPA